jgi:hypothetical protein
MAAIAPQFDQAPRREGISSGFSAVSWPAVFAGAIAAAALSLILMVLGTGLGLTLVSPWASRGASAETISWSTIGWITFQALAASGLGGYIAGRLRVKWTSVHTDEVYFRDTAHGFLAWAVATLITAMALTSVIGGIVGAGTKAVAGVAAGGVQIASQGVAAAASTAAQDTGTPSATSAQQSSTMYLVDSLFRVDPSTQAAGVNAGTSARGMPPSPTGNEAANGNSRNEIARILDNGMRAGSLPADDTRYIAQLVAQRTGMSQQDAEARVNAAYQGAQKKMQEAEATARQAADQARKAGAYAALWIFVSLLLGAFVASLAATWGGRRRDLY